MAQLLSSGGNAGASETGLALAASDGNVVARDAGVAVGTNAELNTGVKATTTSGNVTIGETNLGMTFADTVEKLTEQNTATLASLVNNAAPATIPSPTDLAEEETEPTAAKWSPWKVVAVAVAVVLALLLVFRKK